MGNINEINYCAGAADETELQTMTTPGGAAI